MEVRAYLAHGLSCAGRSVDAKRIFGEAEQLQEASDPARPRLWFFPGFLYCVFLLEESVRAAGSEGLEYCVGGIKALSEQLSAKSRKNIGIAIAIKFAREVLQRSKEMYDWAEDAGYILSRGLAQLSQANAKLLMWFYTGKGGLRDLKELYDSAIDDLDTAGELTELTRGLIGRARFSRICRRFADSKRDLYQARKVANRPGMRLTMIDYYLESIRLLMAENRGNAKHCMDGEEGIGIHGKPCLDEAERLVRETGFVLREKEVQYIKNEMSRA